MTPEEFAYNFSLDMNGVHEKTESMIKEISDRYGIPFTTIMRWYIERLTEELQEDYYGQDE